MYVCMYIYIYIYIHFWTEYAQRFNVFSIFIANKVFKIFFFFKSAFKVNSRLNYLSKVNL